MPLDAGAGESRPGISNVRIWNTALSGGAGRGRTANYRLVQNRMPTSTCI